MCVIWVVMSGEVHGVPITGGIVHNDPPQLFIRSQNKPSYDALSARTTTHTQ